MHDVLLILHFIGLMLGAGGGFGNMIVARTALAAPPEQAMTLRQLGPKLSRLSSIGLALMLATGIALVFVSYGGFSGLPALFWVKLVFVTTLTAAAIAVELTYPQVKAGNLKAAKRLPVLGPVSGVSSLLAVIFAVLAFH